MASEKIEIDLEDLNFLQDQIRNLKQENLIFNQRQWLGKLGGYNPVIGDSGSGF